MLVQFPGTLLTLREAGSLYRNKFWFIPVPRTGSTAINNEIKNEFGEFHAHQGTIRYHQTAQNYRAMFGADVWEQMFTFGFVRNPWDRMVSWSGCQCPGQSKDSFAEFVRGSHPRHFRFNCLDYLVDANGTCMVDFVATFEQVQNNFDTICDRIGIAPRGLSVLNSSQRKQYTTYYDEDLRNYIGRECRKDIEYFAYKFDKLT